MFKRSPAPFVPPLPPDIDLNSVSDGDSPRIESINTPRTSLEEARHELERTLKASRPTVNIEPHNQTHRPISRRSVPPSPLGANDPYQNAPESFSPPPKADADTDVDEFKNPRTLFEPIAEESSGYGTVESPGRAPYMHFSGLPHDRDPGAGVGAKTPQDHHHPLNRQRSVHLDDTRYWDRITPIPDIAIEAASPSVPKLSPIIHGTTSELTGSLPPGIPPDPVTQILPSATSPVVLPLDGTLNEVRRRRPHPFDSKCFLAHHPKLGTIVLKRAHKHRKTGDDVWRTLKHEHILPYLGKCTILGDPYLGFPDAATHPILQFLGTGPLASERERLLQETASALVYLHERKIKHGRVCTSNILISHDWHVLLCNFESSAFNCTGEVLADDVFDFGVTIAEVLKGTKCRFWTPKFRIRRPRRPSPQSLYLILWDVAEQCWESSPLLRPTISEVHDDLARIASSAKSPPATHARTTAPKTLDPFHVPPVPPIPSYVPFSPETSNPVHPPYSELYPGGSIPGAPYSGSLGASYPGGYPDPQFYNPSSTQFPAYGSPMRSWSSSYYSTPSRYPSPPPFLPPRVGSWNPLTSSAPSSGNAMTPLEPSTLFAKTQVPHIPTRRSPQSYPVQLPSQPPPPQTQAFPPSTAVANYRQPLSPNQIPPSVPHSFAEFASPGPASPYARSISDTPLIRSDLGSFHPATPFQQGPRYAQPLTPRAIPPWVHQPQSSAMTPQPARKPTVDSPRTSAEMPRPSAWDATKLPTEPPPDQQPEGPSLPPGRMRKPRKPRSRQFSGNIDSTASEPPTRFSPAGGVLKKPDPIKWEPCMSSSKASSAGRYRRMGDHPFGMGGFSNVWLGVLLHLDNTTSQVAVKELRQVKMAQLDSAFVMKEMLKRLKREILIWMDLDHPNIAPLIGFTVDVTVCLISPWYKNGRITKYIEDHPTCNRLKLLEEVACGLDYLHTGDPAVVHGDIKPDNILVDDDGCAVLIDFGLSRIQEEISPSVVSSFRGMGVIRWMAPELADGEVAKTARSDVYSFGCLCLEILTEEIPFKAIPSPTAVTLALARGTKPVTNRKDYPKLEETSALWGIMDSCWDADPIARPPIGDLQRKISEIRERDALVSNEREGPLLAGQV